MGIDIYTDWKDKAEEEAEAQITGWDSAKGEVGYLREAYHGGPYVTHYLVKEAFENKDGEAKIPAPVLRERLPRAVILAIMRESLVYGKDKSDPSVIDLEVEGIDALTKKIMEGPLLAMKGLKSLESQDIADKMEPDTVKHGEWLISHNMLSPQAQAFVDFVELCEKKEKETGGPVLIRASY